MCIETMDTRTKRMKPDCRRKSTARPGSKLKWGLLRVSTEEDEALRRCRASAVRTTIRKHLRREQRRAQLAKLTRVLGDLGKTEKPESRSEGGPAAGAMAPENTTQYLMSNAYEDMEADGGEAGPVSHGSHASLYGESLSPRSVYAVLDSGYEGCLAFQQRDFEEAFGLCW